MREKDGQTSYQCLPKPGFTCVVLLLFFFFFYCRIVLIFLQRFSLFLFAANYSSFCWLILSLPLLFPFHAFFLCQCAHFSQQEIYDSLFMFLIFAVYSPVFIHLIGKIILFITQPFFVSVLMTVKTLFSN